MKNVLIEIAKNAGVSTETVRREIEIAIEMARRNPDPKIQAFWKSVPCKGDYPTPEEAILHIAKIVKKKI